MLLRREHNDATWLAQWQYIYRAAPEGVPCGSLLLHFHISDIVRILFFILNVRFNLYTVDIAIVWSNMLKINVEINCQGQIIVTLFLFV